MFVILMALLLILLCVRLSLKITTVEGDSMFPALEEGDRLLTRTLMSHLGLRRGQVVVGEVSAFKGTFSYKNQEFDFRMLPDELFDDELIEPLEDIELLYLEDENLSDELWEEPIELDDDMPQQFVKRLTGLPGDRICIPLNSLHKVMQKLLEANCDDDGNLVWVIPPGHCFVRGDSPVCVDSLTVGPIPISALKGVSLCKLKRRSPRKPVETLT